MKERAQLTGTTLDSEIGGDKYGGAVGFGKGYSAAYGLGKSVDFNDQDSYRFKDEVDADAVPDVLKKKGKVAGWKGMDDAHDQKTLEKKQKIYPFLQYQDLQVTQKQIENIEKNRSQPIRKNLKVKKLPKRKRPIQKLKKQRYLQKLSLKGRVNVV